MMTAKILPTMILFIALGISALVWRALGETGGLDGAATLVATQDELSGETARGVGGAPEIETGEASFDERQLIKGIRLQVWENRLFVASDEPIEVHVGVFEDKQPLHNREPVLLLAYPDDNQKVYRFPPTTEDGHTSLLLPPVTASSGTLIAYEVCIEGLGGTRQCVGENYLIWNNE